MDPWGQIEDLYGDALYKVLKLERAATDDDVKRAYRQLAKVHHPDKGGEPSLFAQVQHAYEVLSDRKRRQVYDTWAKELQFNYARAPGSQPLGGEDILLDEFDSLGLHCTPGSQLVVTCEVCRRPATKQCWTCNMQICEFCTLKRHWKDGVPLHWPLINVDHMKERLAKRELEKKRIDDARRLALEDPNHRSDKELQDIRAFKQAAHEMSERVDRLVAYDLRLAKFYMWAQTARTVFIAVRVPTGYADRELFVECTGSGIVIQPEKSPPVIDRYLAHTIDISVALETLKTKDNRVCVVALPKGVYGEHWGTLFRGDSDGVRCMLPPYVLTETDDDVILEIGLPFWIDATDVRVDFTPTKLIVDVRNTLHIERSYWRNTEEDQRRRDYEVINIEECSWCLEEDVDASGERCKLLMITLARPELTEEEIMWKKGRRQDNRAAKRPGSMHLQGFRFFADDEDVFEVEDILQALCFMEQGLTYVAPKPWNVGEQAKQVGHEALLSQQARAFVAHLRKQQQQQGS